MRTPTVEQLILRLGLRPLPREGGYFRETYRAADCLSAGALPSRYGRDKAASTAIYYLLTPDTFSALHRLPTDEVYNFYLGGPVEMLLLADGRGRTVLLGSDVLADQQPQVVVPHGVWQGSRLVRRLLLRPARNHHGSRLRLRRLRSRRPRRPDRPVPRLRRLDRPPDAGRKPSSREPLMTDTGPAHDNPWTRLSRTVVYQNPWITLFHDEVRRPDGLPGIYGVVHYRNRAVGVVPLDEQDRVLLVGQYRYTLDLYSWEIPEGGGGMEEELLAAAQRELLEETGYSAGAGTSWCGAPVQLGQ